MAPFYSFQTCVIKALDVNIYRYIGISIYLLIVGSLEPMRNIVFIKKQDFSFVEVNTESKFFYSFIIKYNQHIFYNLKIYKIRNLILRNENIFRPKIFSQKKS